MDLDEAKILNETKYKTLPGEDAKEIKMAVGGDVGFEGDGEKITKNLVNYNPDVLIIGGDIAYDDGMRSCFYSWDNFYWIFEDLNREVGRMIPLILSIGNHDVGYDALASVKTDMAIDKVPYFFLFNPQHLSGNNKFLSVPSPE